MKTIIRKNHQVLVKEMRLGDLDPSRLSYKFRSHNFDLDMVVNVKCFADGQFDLRGKNKEYRIVVED